MNIVFVRCWSVCAEAMITKSTSGQISTILRRLSLAKRNPSRYMFRPCPCTVLTAHASLTLSIRNAESLGRLALPLSAIPQLCYFTRTNKRLCISPPALNQPQTSPSLDKGPPPATETHSGVSANASSKTMSRHIHNAVDFKRGS